MKLKYHELNAISDPQCLIAKFMRTLDQANIYTGFGRISRHFAGGTAHDVPELHKPGVGGLVRHDVHAYMDR